MKNNTADKEALLEKVLRSFRAYYNIDRETPAEPFDAEASFDMRDEQYFLTKSARISQSDSHETYSVGGISGFSSVHSV